MLRSPLMIAGDKLEHAAAQLRTHRCPVWPFETVVLPLTCTLLLASYVMPGTWVVVLALMATASCVVAESERRSYNAARKGRYQRLFPPKPTSLEPKEATAARARWLGLDPDQYDGDEELIQATGSQKSLHVTQLGQVVRYYEQAKPGLGEFASKVMLPCVLPEDGGDLEFYRLSTEGKGDIPPVSDSQADEIVRCASLTTRLMVKTAVWRGLGSSAPERWTASTINPSISGPDSDVIVWDIPCASHPALQRMYDLYVEQMSTELQPTGPAWDWLLQRPEERKFNHWSRQPLREQDKAMWYTMERTKPVGHQLIVFGRSSYIFGKYRLKKSIRATEIADKMLPSLNELGVETEGATPRIRSFAHPFFPLPCAPIYRSTAAIYCSNLRLSNF